MTRLIFAATFALAVAVAGDADAKQCRAASGKFIKCAVPTATTTTNHCRDPKTGRFVKCPAKPVSSYQIGGSHG